MRSQTRAISAYTGRVGPSIPDKEGIDRTCIQLNNAGKGPSAWYIGVCSPMESNKMPSDHKERRGRLDKKLKEAFHEGTGKRTDRWPWHKYVNSDKSDWRQLVPDLHRECQDQGGEIMTYFVDTFIDIAETAIPVINGIERLN